MVVFFISISFTSRIFQYVLFIIYSYSLCFFLHPPSSSHIVSYKELSWRVHPHNYAHVSRVMMGHIRIRTCTLLGGESFSSKVFIMPAYLPVGVGLRFRS